MTVQLCPNCGSYMKNSRCQCGADWIEDHSEPDEVSTINTPDGYKHLPVEIQSYLFGEPRGPKPAAFHALPLPPDMKYPYPIELWEKRVLYPGGSNDIPGLLNAIRLWGAVYELQPHGLIARAFCIEQAWAERIAALLNTDA